MAGKETPWVLDEDDALDLLALLLTSARTQVDEAREYGPLRLIMPGHRVADAMSPRSSPETQALLAPGRGVETVGSSSGLGVLTATTRAIGRRDCTPGGNR
jgi:hypothetical protein